MGIIFGSVTESTEDFLVNVPTSTFASTSTIMECTLDFVNELNSEWSSLMESMLVKELTVLESTGSEMVYEANGAANFIEKIKEFFSNLWSKFTGIIKKWYEAVDDMLHDTANFIKKYKDDFIAGAKLIPSQGLTIKGYDFAGLKDASQNIKNADTAIDRNSTFERLLMVADATGTFTSDYAAAIKEIKDQQPEYESKIVKILGSPTGSVGKFNEEIKKFYYGAETKSIKSVNTTEMLNDVTTAQAAKKEVKAIYNEFKNGVNKQIKEVNSWKKGLDKSDDLISVKMALINSQLVSLRFNKTKTATTVGVILSAMGAKLRQDKETIKRVAGLATKASKITKPDTKAVGESSTSDFESEIFGSEDL